MKSILKYLAQDITEFTEQPMSQLRSIMTLLLTELDLSVVMNGLMCKLC